MSDQSQKELGMKELGLTSFTCYSNCVANKIVCERKRGKERERDRVRKEKWEKKREMGNRKSNAKE